MLKELIEGDENGVIFVDDLRVNRLRPGLVNIMKKDAKEEFTNADLNAFRAMLIDAGYREYESWVAVQGASWLHSGLFAGVSIRYAKI